MKGPRTGLRLRCAGCGREPRRRLTWPEDAYFVFTVRKAQVWAYHREHLEAIRRYIASPLRGQGKEWKLYKLPAEAIRAGNREVVLRKIDRLLTPSARGPQAPSMGQTSARRAVEGLKRFGKGRSLRGLRVKDLIAEGRR